MSIFAKVCLTGNWPAGSCDADVPAQNMYLAEDRILCFELVSKANASWLLTCKSLPPILSAQMSR